MSQTPVDFSRLYGDLCRKLLNTPVGEIFPEVVTGNASKHVATSTGSTTISSVHPAFPAFSPMAAAPVNYMSTMPAMYSPNHLLMMASGMSHGLNSPEQLNNAHSSGALFKNGFTDMAGNPSTSPGSDMSTEYMENIDVQKLVDEFRITLERYGVSQRFAARFIMQDTSQGNLSFLMEKGRNKKWEELSPRGRLPYIKMKAWLESREQQVATLEMLKYSQESRKNSSRESYNRRERFTMFQLHVLCRLFEENSNPPMNIRNAVAIRLGIPLDRVNVWFQNQRARGFPARKILQQSLFDNEGDPYLAIDVENMKDKINESQFVPQDIPVNVNSPTNMKRSEQDLSKRPSPKRKEFALPSQNGSVMSVKTEPDETVLPLDLSASSFSDKNRAADIKCSATYPPFNQAGKVESSYIESLKTNQYTFQTNPATKTGASGAAKRKRGSKPQQLIPLYKMETENDGDMLNEIKRRKVSEIASPESKYTYLLDTTDIEQDNLCENGYPNNVYDYVIKSEASPNGKGVINNSPENTRLCDINEQAPKINAEQLQELSESYKLEGKDTDTSAVDKNELLKTRDNHSFKEDTLNPKSVEIFKAMCASLAIKDQNQSDSNLSEPELD